MRKNTHSYPAFPTITQQLGYNPARFLLSTDDAIDELSWAARATAFIRGMDDVETIRAWIEVEVALELGANDGPRKQVIKWLNQRKALIEETDAPSAGTEHRESARDETTDEPAQLTPSEADVGLETALATDGGAQQDETARCSVCQTALIEEEIAGQTGYWCPSCGDFKNPGATAGAPTEDPT